MPGKKQIKEKTKPKNRVQENTKPEDNVGGGIIINFSCPFSFYSCKVGKEYTNYLHSLESFVEKRRVLFGEALHYFSGTTFESLMTNKNGHTHPVPSYKIKLVEKILTELVKIKWPDMDHKIIVGNYMTEDIWQLGYKQGLRLVGIRKGNILSLLFIDYNHLIEPDLNYNGPDYFRYSYCPMSSNT